MFEKDVCALWPDATKVPAPLGVTCAMAAGGGHFYYVQQPELAISASLVREYWLAGHPVDYLVPVGVQEVLERHRLSVKAAWQKT